jgi:sulfatase-like protein
MSVESSRRRDVLRAFVDFFALSGFAVAQPLFDVTSRNSTYLVAHALVGRPLFLFALALTVVPPVVMTLVVAGVSLVSRRAAASTRSIFVGSLLMLAICPVVVHNVRLPSVVANALYGVVAVGGYVLHRRLPIVKRYLIILSPAPLVLATLFLTVGSASVLFRPPPTEPAVASSSDQETPVVHVVLDEFSLGSILKPNGEIDGRRFPNFSRLARMSTWYANATTNSNDTRRAVPAALTGRLPRGEHEAPPPPTVGVYPRNLFSLLASSHTLRVSEVVTSLCPAGHCRTRALPAASAKDVAADNALLYLHNVSPPFARRFLPSLPETQWGGFFTDPLTVPDRVSHLPRLVQPIGRRVLASLADAGATPYSNEVRRFDALIDSFRRSARPTLWFHHALLPHTPWHLNERAQPYDDQVLAGFVRGGFANEQAAEQGLQRYLLQVKATDRLVGRMIDRLKAEHIWDDALVVLHADHGVTLEPRGPYRSVLHSPTELLPIPLFVKYPGQSKGRVDRRNAELIDVLPTEADVLGITLPWTSDGSSLRGKDPHRTHKIAWQWDAALPPFEDPIDPTTVSKRIAELFGTWQRRDDLYAWGPYRDDVGRRVSSFRREDPRLAHPRVEEPGRFAQVDVDGPYIPARVTASMTGDLPDWVAVALNGRIAGLTRPLGGPRRWVVSAMLSSRMFRDGRNVLAFYAVDGEDLIPLT